MLVPTLQRSGSGESPARSGESVSRCLTHTTGQPELLLGHSVHLHMGLSIMVLDLLNRLGSRSDYLELLFGIYLGSKSKSLLRLDWKLALHHHHLCYIHLLKAARVCLVLRE